MNILVLTKRQYTNKDILDDHYGRMWEIPLFLQIKGHSVKKICLSYRLRNEGVFCFTFKGAKIEWVSFNFSSFFSYISYIRRQIKSFKPDIIWVSSDCFHVIFGWLLGKIYEVKTIVDLYDNYEAYKLSKLSGIIPLYRLAVSNADAISVISKPLYDLVTTSYRAKGKISIIENAINLEVFYPRNKAESRKKYNLPENAKIIGTAGALDEGRGIKILYSAFDQISNEMPDLYMAVAGPGNREHFIFSHPKIRDLGILSNQDIVFLFSALDVAIICNRDSDFGRYCFPQKAHEILASKTPLISANIGAMAELLKENPECLYDPTSALDLALKITMQLKNPTDLKIPINTWAQQAELLEILMDKTLMDYGQ